LKGLTRIDGSVGEQGAGHTRSRDVYVSELVYTLVVNCPRYAPGQSPP
jgi:hypothetical protein